MGHMVCGLLITVHIETKFSCVFVWHHCSIGGRTWGPSVFCNCLNVQTETSVPAATESCCWSFAVTWGFLTTCLLWNMVATIDNFLLAWYTVLTCELSFQLYLLAYSATLLSLLVLTCTQCHCQQTPFTYFLMNRISVFILCQCQ